MSETLIKDKLAPKDSQASHLFATKLRKNLPYGVWIYILF